MPMISFRWETVRTYGDTEPARLETAIRDVLAKEGGAWQVTVRRAGDGWRLRLEQPRTDQAPIVVVTTNIQTPIAAGADLQALLADALRQ
jgi:hypothetical protein